jgi:hypothetical protein
MSMNELEIKIVEISNKYKELKKCEFHIIQKAIICELRKLSNQAMLIIQKMQENSELIRKRKQI